MATLRGSCHCGQLRVDLRTSQDPAKLNPRVCDCSFCDKHGAAYVSDPEGSMCILETAAGALRSYRQGSGIARFVLCSTCGVLMGVHFTTNGRIYGAVNASCLDKATALGTYLAASLQGLSPDERVSRWSKLWVPHVIVMSFGDVNVGDSLLGRR